MLRLIVSLLGLGLSSSLYLSSASSSGLCGGSSGCQTVLGSSFASIFGLPVSVLGLSFFAFVAVLSLRQVVEKEDQINPLVIYLSFPAALVSLYYILVQVQSIGAFCWVCNVTHLLVFILAFLAYKDVKSTVKPSLTIKESYQGVLWLFTPVLLFVLFSNSTSTQDRVAVTGKNGFKVTVSELDKPIATQLFDLESKIYTLRESSIKGLILKNEAESQDLELGAYLQKEVGSKVIVTDAQIEAFKKQYGNRIPKTWKNNNIKQYLKSQQSQGLQESLVSRLISSGDYSVKLSKPEQQAVTVFKNPNGSLSTNDAVAPIQIIEFSDIQCPYCSRAHTALKNLQNQFKGKINVTFRHFPLSFHKEAEPAARAVVCAKADDKAWDLLDVLFDNQKALSVEMVKQSAYQVGVDKTKFDTCFESKFAKETVSFDVAEANRLGINSTPTLIINGKIHKGLPSENLIRSLLN